MHDYTPKSCVWYALGELPTERDTKMSRRSAAAGSNPPIDIHTTVQMPNAATPEKKTEDKPDFWTYMHSLTPEQWKDHIVYLTRENPKTSINGIGGYLTKLQQPFDIEDIKLAYGGYEFSYIMKKGNDLVYGGRFRVEAPPKYDPSRENSTSSVASSASATMGGDVLKVLEQQNERLYQVLTTLQGAKEDNPAVSGAIEMLTSAYKTGLSAVATPHQSNTDAATQLQTMLSIGEKIANLRGPGLDIEKILANPLIAPLIQRLLNPDPLADITKLGAVLDVLDKLRGGGGEAAPKDWKAALVSQGMQYVPEILNALKEGNAGTVETARLRAIESQNRARAAEVLDAQRRGVAPPSGLQPAAQVQPIRPQPVVVASRAPAIRIDGGLQTEALNAQPGAAAQEMPLDEAVQRAQYDETMKVQVVNLLRMGCSGETIADFLYDVKPEFCAELAKYTPEMITTFFANDPILKLAVEDPRWQEVLNEAHDYIVETEAEEAKEAAPA